MDKILKKKINILIEKIVYSSLNLKKKLKVLNLMT